MKILINKWICILVGMFGFSLFSQEPSIGFEHFDNLPSYVQSPVSSILQDHKGFVWIGTKNGLMRFDGYEFKRFTRGDNSIGNLSNNHVNVIYEDSQKNIWIGTENGINRFVRPTNQFLPIDILLIKGGRNYISSILEDRNGKIWVGTFGGVKLLDTNKNKLIDLPDGLKVLNKSRVLSLFQDQENNIWIGTSEGIKIFNPSLKKIRSIPEEVGDNKNLSSSKVWKIVQDNSGIYWFATEENGIFSYDKELSSIKQFTFSDVKKSTPLSNWINDILVVDDQYIWFATNKGLSIYNKSLEHFFNYTHDPIHSFSLSDNMINRLMKDKHGNVWLGTYGGGINFYSPKNSLFKTIQETVRPNFGLNSSIVTSVAESSPQKLWVGTFDGGLNLLDLKNRESKYYTIQDSNTGKSNSINALYALNDKELWCGVQEKLFKFDIQSKRFISVLSSNEIKRPITSLVADDNGVWIGTDGDGLKYYSKEKSKKVISFKRSEKDSIYSISDNFITDLKADKKGLWIATQNGLNYFDKKEQKLIKQFYKNELTGLSNNNITTLYLSPVSGLWVGTDYGGLSNLDTEKNKFYIIDESCGFTNTAIRNIEEGPEGFLWVNSDEGLYKIGFEKNRLGCKNAHLAITKFSQKDGLQPQKFSPNTSLKLSDGQLVFGGVNGITLFDTKELIHTKTNGVLQFTGLKVNNKEVDSTQTRTSSQKDITEIKEIWLKHNQGYLDISFSGLDYVSRDNTTYEYRLDTPDFEDNWHTIGTQNSLNLTNLSPGEYFFKLRIENSQDPSAARSLKINILPPFWKTTWAYSAYFVLLLLVTCIIVVIIRNRIRLKKRLYKESVENERQQEVYQMKLDFFTNISHELRTPLTLINGHLDDLLNRFQDQEILTNKLGAIRNNSNRLLKLINELMGFRKAEKGMLKIYFEEQDILIFLKQIFYCFESLAQQKEIIYKFQIKSSLNSSLVYFDRNQLEKVLYNILHNAFKFTQKGEEVNLSLEEKEDRFVIEIEDTGIGISLENQQDIFRNFFQADDPRIQNMGSGIGLALSKKIIDLHQGIIQVYSQQGIDSKTIFTIELKKGKNHLNKEQLKEVSPQLKDSLVHPITPSINSNENFLGDNSAQIENRNKKTIYIIDDNKEIREFLVGFLKEEYCLIEFSNAQDALIQIEQKKLPDLIISDVMMPGISGFEFCEELKNNEHTRHIPIILLTAKASSPDRVEGLSKGANVYISKPFSIKVLKLNIVNLLTTQAVMKEKFSGNFVLDSHISKLTTPEEKFVKILMQIIEKKMEDPEFDVDALVKEIGMSRSVLYKKVKNLTGQSVAALIKNLRLKRAAEVLISTSFSVSEVAYMVGFNNRKHFSREFKKIYNISPSEYKNENPPVTS